MLVEDRRCGEDEAADGGMDDGFDQENMVKVCEKLLRCALVVVVRVFVCSGGHRWAHALHWWAKRKISQKKTKHAPCSSSSL